MAEQYWPNYVFPPSVTGGDPEFFVNPRELGKNPCDLCKVIHHFDGRISIDFCQLHSKKL